MRGTLFAAALCAAVALAAPPAQAFGIRGPTSAADTGFATPYTGNIYREGSEFFLKIDGTRYRIRGPFLSWLVDHPDEIVGEAFWTGDRVTMFGHIEGEEFVAEDPMLVIPLKYLGLFYMGQIDLQFGSGEQRFAPSKHWGMRSHFQIQEPDGGGETR